MRRLIYKIKFYILIKSILTINTIVDWPINNVIFTELFIYGIVKSQILKLITITTITMEIFVFEKRQELLNILEK